MAKGTCLTIKIVFSMAIIIAISTAIVVTRYNCNVKPYSGVLTVQIDEFENGTCFVVAHQNGWYYAITANHVISDPYSFFLGRLDSRPVVTVDNEHYEAEVVRVSSQDDLALLQFKSPENYKIYSLAKVETGESCMGVGWRDGSFLLYRGHVISPNLNGYIVANGGVVPGCSGGPLLNEDNEVIGITVQFSVYRGWAFDSTIRYVPSRFAMALIVTIGD